MRKVILLLLFFISLSSPCFATSSFGNAIKGDPGTSGTIGTNGTDGVGISLIEKSAEGYLNITYTNSTKVELGNITGAKGDQGTPGVNGTNGTDGTNGTNGSLMVMGTPCIKSPWANNSTTTQAHGLGDTPDYVYVYLTCINADLGYTAGDTIVWNAVVDTATSAGAVVLANATNVVIRTFNAIRMCNKGSMAEAGLTPANWNITAVPWKFQP